MSKKLNQKAALNIWGVIIDEHLSFNEYMNTVQQELNTANDILAKLRYYVTDDILKAVNYAHFDP